MALLCKNPDSTVSYIRYRGTNLDAIVVVHSFTTTL